jgi:hypothetical protein
MGTRGLVGWKIDGEYHGTYCHWDSYPSGLGRDVSSWIHGNLKTDEDINDFKEKLTNLTYVKESDQASEDLQERYKKYADISVAEKSLSSWYCLLRDLQGVGYLQEIKAGNLKHAVDGIAGIRDSLFCEYAYILNMDDKAFSFFEGHQTSSQIGNPFGTDANSDGYYPCALMWEVPFKDAVERMEQEIDKDEKLLLLRE